MLWERVRSRYGMSVLSGRYGCRTWLELVLTRWKNSSSAVSNRSATVGTSSAQYPSRLPRRSSDSRRARSAAEHIPDQAGAAYRIRERIVARKMKAQFVPQPCGVPVRWPYLSISKWHRIVRCTERPASCVPWGKWTQNLNNATFRVLICKYRPIDRQLESSTFWLFIQVIFFADGKYSGQIWFWTEDLYW